MSTHFLRVFNRDHQLLDELDNFDNLTYSWTLDDSDTLNFQLSLSDPKRTTENLQYFNHIEIVDNSSGITVWGGIVAGHDFNDPNEKINCLSYDALLKYRRFRAKTYDSFDYGNLSAELISDLNRTSPTGVIIGNIAAGSLKTTFTTKNTDMALSTIKSLFDDTNYDWDIDENRMFNFYLRKGNDKPLYSLTYGGEADNIISAPERAEDVMSMANSVYTEILDSDNNIKLSSLAQDFTSQSIFGLVEGTVSGSNTNDATQSDLDIKTNAGLQDTNWPADSFTVKIKDSTLCPFDDITVGDAVTVNLIPYDNFSALMRILKMEHDEKTGTRSITFGTTIFRSQPPVKKLYKNWRMNNWQ
ncbi:MAG TPA: hypothetical protein DEP42_04900 [Ruminococcaceae bacterium]|nr:hypothetical protein [Oscillospiraceae bacterium]